MLTNNPATISRPIDLARHMRERRTPSQIKTAKIIDENNMLREANNHLRQQIVSRDVVLHSVLAAIKSSIDRVGVQSAIEMIRAEIAP